MEILSRLAGRTTFVTPKGGGRGGVPITDLDVAAAIASAKDKMGSSMAMAIACQRPQEWPRVHDLAHPRLMSLLAAQRQMPGIVDGPHRFRARIALWDGFNELLYPLRRHPLPIAAKSARMRAKAYGFLLHHALCLLDNAANEAAGQATQFLFRRVAEIVGIDPSTSVHIGVTEDGDLQIDVAETEIDERQGATVAPSDPSDELIDLLFTEPRSRPRRAGVLTLSKPRS